MDLFIIRSKKQLSDLKELLDQRRLPFKVALQDIYPGRSLLSNAYYWGIVLKLISDATGHTQIECHEGYKHKYNFRHDIAYNPKTGQYEWVMDVGSTAALDEKEMWDYIFKVRADGEIEHHIIIPLPSECFIPELQFENNKIKHKRL